MKRKIKLRKLSIRTKILVPVELIIILICICMGVMSYRRISSGMIEMGVEEAKMAANIVAQVIDGDAVASIQPGSENTQTHADLLAQLRKLRSDCGIEYLYTLYESGGKIYYGIDTDESNPSSIGTPYTVSYDTLSTVFKGEDYVENFIDRTDDGNTISAYAPVRGSDGKVVAIIGSDYNADHVLERLNSTIVVVVITALICVVLSSILLNVIITMIIRNLRKVEEKIYDLVHREGDLTQKLDVKTGDELEVISDDVNELLEHIRGIMLEIADNSSKLQGSSKQVVSDLGSAQMGVSEVSSTMEQMSAAMQETSASVIQIDEIIKHINTSIQDIFNQANEGNRFSEDMTNRAIQVCDSAMVSKQDAQEKAKAMSDMVNKALERSKAVEEISVLTDNILEITEQTNLLALNASIEAARAGEAGRGFAVVADEIGKLANNSSEAAEQIRIVSEGVIKAVDELAAETEKMMKFLEETALTGYEKLVENGQHYRDDASSMNTKMQDFANTSAQISSSMNSIKEAVEAVNIAVEESTEGIVNVTATSVELIDSMANVHKEADGNMEISDKLYTEVNKFKLQ